MEDLNPLTAWADSNVILEQGARVQVGVATPAKRGGYVNQEEWLYPNYLEYCEANGVDSISLRRFSNVLLDLFPSDLVTKKRYRGCAYFYGIRLR